MTPTDLARLTSEAFEGARVWTADEIEAIASAPGGFLLGSKNAGLLARVVADEAEILTLVTAREERRRGHGLKLLIGFEAQAQARGARNAFLEVGSLNAPARALYEKAGYREVGRRMGYYRTSGGASETALILKRALNGTDAG